MRLRALCFVAIVGLFAFSGLASATVLTFDDISTGGSVVGMPAGYGGFTWDSNIGVYGTPQDPYNPKSAPNRVLFNYNCCVGVYGESDAIVNSGTVVFNGAYFSGYAIGGPVYFNLYDGGALVWTSGSLTPTSTPTFLASGYSGQVDKIGIVGNEGYFVMDNFTFNGSSVPEPTSLLMLGSGALGLAGILRRKLVR